MYVSVVHDHVEGVEGEYVCACSARPCGGCRRGRSRTVARRGLLGDAPTPVAGIEAEASAHASRAHMARGRSGGLSTPAGGVVC